MILLVLLVAAAPQARATESIVAGTIVIVAQAKDYIIFAADSRVGASNGNAVASVDDTYCKIGPLHGNTLFAAAGIVTDPARSWSADTEMDKVLVENWHGARMGSVGRQKSASAPLGRIDDAKAVRASARINWRPIRSPMTAWLRRVCWRASIRMDAPGFTSARSVWMPARGLVHQESDMTSHGSATRYSGLGQSEIAVEFDHGSTGRAIEERAQWKEKNLSGIEFDRFKARRLVELTIQYLPNKSDVGGPIDELELDANGPHWIQVKPHCKQ